MLEKRTIKDVCIYVLKDPETKEIRYVGKTLQPLNIRLNNHFKETCNSRKYQWMCSLSDKKLKPFIHVIDCIKAGATVQEITKKEIYWILFYKQQGCDLFNLVFADSKRRWLIDNKIINASEIRKQRALEKEKERLKKEKELEIEMEKWKIQEEKLKLREEKKFLKKQEKLEKRRKLYELGEIEECDIHYSGIVVTKTTRAKISAANKRTKRRKAINAKISASLKAFHKKNKIPFNQRKSLIADNSNLAF